MKNTCFAQSGIDLEQLRSKISNGQLVIYTESSILSDSNSSALTYVDFCPDGTYYYNYEGSYTVRGTQGTSNSGNRGYGTGKSSNSGNWDIIEYMDAFYLQIIDINGLDNYYPINLYYLAMGKWKHGNTTYVFAPGRGRCNF